MKNKFLLSLLIVPIVFFYTSCCHDCVNKGEKWDLPYSQDQSISFKSTTNQHINYSANISESLPPEKYCGPLGSQSYYFSCNGGNSATLYSKDDTTVVIQKINFLVTTNDQFDSFVQQNVKINNAVVSQYQGDIFTKSANSMVQKDMTLNLNGKQYTGLFLFTSLESKAKIGDCISFYGSFKTGVIQFSIKRAGGIDVYSLFESTHRQ